MLEEECHKLFGVSLFLLQLFFHSSSTVPLLPGSAIYYAMQYLLWGQPDQAVAYAAQTLQIATGMGLGAVLVAVPIRLLRAHREQK